MKAEHQSVAAQAGSFVLLMKLCVFFHAVFI
jgi:hypothetical protein